MRENISGLIGVLFMAIIIYCNYLFKKRNKRQIEIEARELLKKVSGYLDFPKDIVELLSDPIWDFGACISINMMFCLDGRYRNNDFSILIGKPIDYVTHFGAYVGVVLWLSGKLQGREWKQLGVTTPWCFRSHFFPEEQIRIEDCGIYKALVYKMKLNKILLAPEPAREIIEKCNKLIEAAERGNIK